jgi:hypothetical protein
VYSIIDCYIANQLPPYHAISNIFVVYVPSQDQFVDVLNDYSFPNSVEPDRELFFYQDAATGSGALLRVTYGPLGGIEVFGFVNHGFGIFPETTPIAFPVKTNYIIALQLQSNGTCF